MPIHVAEKPMERASAAKHASLELEEFGSCRARRHVINGNARTSTCLPSSCSRKSTIMGCHIWDCSDGGGGGGGAAGKLMVVGMSIIHSP